MRTTLGHLRQIIKEAKPRFPVEGSPDESFDRAWLQRINYGSIEDLLQVMLTPAGREYTKCMLSAVSFPVKLYHAPLDERDDARFWAWTSDRRIAASFMEEAGEDEDDIMTTVVDGPDDVLAYNDYEHEFVLRK